MIAELANNVVTMLPAVVDESGSFWNFVWTVPEELQTVTQKIAFMLGVVWLFFILSQFVIPSKRGGGGRGLKPGAIIMVLVAIVILCDLSLVPTAINWVGKFAWMAAEMIGLR